MKAPDLARLVFLAALWGGSFIFIRIAAPVLGPIVLVTIRVFLAGSALLVYALITRSDLELRTRWRQYLILGALNSAIPFVLISTAELQLPASLAAILNATSPLFGAVIAAIWIKDPLTRRKIAGLVLGLIGVGVLVGWSPTEFTPVVALAAGASLLGAAFYGLASVYTKAKVVGARPIGMATGSQFAAGLLLLPFVPFSTPRRLAIDHGSLQCAGVGAAVHGAGIPALLPPDRGRRPGEGVDRDVPGADLRHALGRAYSWGSRSRSAQWRDAGWCWPARRWSPGSVWGHGRRQAIASPD